MQDEEPTLPWDEDGVSAPAAAVEAAFEVPAEEASTPAASRGAGPTSKAVSRNPDTVPEEEQVLTVSEVNRLAKRNLEEITVSVVGEVSKLTTGYAYYVYLDLRDHDACLPAILTQQQFKSLDFALEDGASVVARGTLTLYERQGKYQIRVLELRPFGEGEIRRRIEALKKKLLAEGLFADDRKKTLPRFPERIGVVTSPSGAAVRDVLVTIQRRYPPAGVFLRGVRVQGTSAVPQICAALDFFDAEWQVDVVILARGGGSLQDLEPFNSEEVARAIARMSTPVVSGIGHEPDVTIADLVADWRASTPTGAAEVVVPDRSEVSALLANAASLLGRREKAEIAACSARLGGVASRQLFRNPEYILGPAKQRWERAASALPGSPTRGLAKGIHRLEAISCRPVYRRAAALLAGAMAILGGARQSMGRAAVRRLERRCGELDKVKARLDALSPLAVLERGYSITFKAETGEVVRSSDAVEVGEEVAVMLARGRLGARITEKE